ncbi:uncharacterized protein LOC125894154 isoform X17 [Epinephelus fuscoguttatus]|uniref:uncharacterized protein LOC125894154 isoform X15 n=1 Tax=Epinephelus fuscoguttatus TaxID=293821 RepID=UPI0020D00C4F|nr:uncharacterized protein LOC125894154 isoform X15 [Epinephelus fuscoguttatus]XP_049441343.1 uncharacterized protein LOC125894154 isoform X16 [Epinephelus fuscoguttatus]XP_049441344.1 uncharacterized protein LOC125894154 isoform X15 [Epinephelus fuscoguttatus]XP_049441345.1 uncharacterized protein LOC125894154 isoform X17 [Epinephelus fuscoguttatus]
MTATHQVCVHSLWPWSWTVADNKVQTCLRERGWLLPLPLSHSSNHPKDLQTIRYFGPAPLNRTKSPILLHGKKTCSRRIIPVAQQRRLEIINIFLTKI